MRGSTFPMWVPWENNNRDDGGDDLQPEMQPPMMTVTTDKSSGCVLVKDDKGQVITKLMPAAQGPRNGGVEDVLAQQIVQKQQFRTAICQLPHCREPRSHHWSFQCPTGHVDVMMRVHPGGSIIWSLETTTDPLWKLLGPQIASFPDHSYVQNRG